MFSKSISKTPEQYALGYLGFLLPNCDFESEINTWIYSARIYFRLFRFSYS